MELLLQRQADLNLRNCAGHTCVMFAVGGGIKVNNQHERAQQYLRAVQLLLDEGAPVNGVTSYGLSALMLASTSGSTALVELLLERAAEVSLASDIGLTALVMAADKGHAGTVGRLLEKLADVNCRYGNGKTPLMSAAAQAYVEVVRVLLQHTADVNAQSENGYTALLYALETQLKDGLVCPIEGSLKKPGLKDTVQLLLHAAADAHVLGPRDQSALDLMSSSEELMGLLESHGSKSGEGQGDGLQKLLKDFLKCCGLALWLDLFDQVLQT